MPMPGRSYTSESYRFGFNGGEKINTVYGSGNYVDLGERGVDTRLGRLNWKIDRFEKDFAFQSPYVFAGNSVIMAVDINGDSTFVIHAKKIGQFLYEDVIVNTLDAGQKTITSWGLPFAGTIVGMARNSQLEVYHNGCWKSKYLIMNKLDIDKA